MPLPGKIENYTSAKSRLIKGRTTHYFHKRQNTANASASNAATDINKNKKVGERLALNVELQTSERTHNIQKVTEGYRRLWYASTSVHMH